MKQGFYLKLALDGMRKNKRLYLPYLLTCAGMVMMFYILSSLSYSPLMETMRGGSIMSMILNLGTFVMALFSLLFLLYTNAFLSRRRNKEFGLYNILGMNKANLSRILLWETLLSALFALVIGLAGGILFSKLTELFLLHMAGEQVGYALSVEPKSIAASAVFFGAIFALILVLSVARVGIFKPLDLLKSETAGEKPPKANWLLALAGVIILGLAYYIAVKIDEPLTAIMMFFAAVLMVIAATYLLFIAGSVVMCRLLQKNKRYYYQPAHFVSVSSMAFRMRRNGAGLASICILATMVLVMLSSTSCLYFGGDDALHSAHPYDMQLEVDYKSPAACTDEARERLNAVARDVAQGREDGLLSYTLLDTAGYFESGTLDVDGVARRVDVSTPASLLERLRTVYVLPLSDYNRLAGAELSLSLGEALIWSSGAPYADDTFAIKGSRTLRVRDTLTELPFKLSAYDTIATTYCVFVPDWTDYATEVTDYVEGLNEKQITARTAQCCSFDLPGVNEEEQLALESELLSRMQDLPGAEADAVRTDVGLACRAEARSDFFSMYGSLFFLGIILSIVFIAAAALIIYYKQLSEGYEDQSRFDIMQKVGMTKREIKSTVNSQVLTVFFAPLLLAGVHLAFAFPFVQKIIRLFGVQNTPLLIVTNIVCFLAFALFYVFVYRNTAKAYYAIVSNGEERR